MSYNKVMLFAKAKTDFLEYLEIEQNRQQKDLQRVRIAVWQAARKLSDGNWLPIVKFRVRKACSFSQGHLTDLELVSSKSMAGLQNGVAEGDWAAFCQTKRTSRGGGHRWKSFQPMNKSRAHYTLQPTRTKHRCP